MASQVRAGKAWRSTSQPSKAAMRGLRLSAIRVCATVVRVSATMKAVNITPQNPADSHNSGEACRTSRARPRGPWRQSSQASTPSAAKLLRQKTRSSPFW
jgi:hypothetical protein